MRDNNLFHLIRVKDVSSTGVTAPVLSCTRASVRVMSASVAEVNHLKPCSLYDPSVWGTATVSVPLAEEKKQGEKGCTPIISFVLHSKTEKVVDVD